jgi:hypothetical protein
METYCVLFIFRSKSGIPEYQKMKSLGWRSRKAGVTQTDRIRAYNTAMGKEGNVCKPYHVATRELAAIPHSNSACFLS